MSEVEQRRVDDIQGEILHVYDGIEEADNQLPNWWLWSFFGSMVFALVYWFFYQTSGIGQSASEAYAMELERVASQSGTVSAELLEGLAASAPAVAEGKAAFVANCVACHREDGGGGIGPNLTDDYWLHGGDTASIYAVVNEGVAAKGMPAWGPALGPKVVQRVTAYVLTLRGTQAKDGKAPQGERSAPGAAAEAADAGS